MSLLQERIKRSSENVVLPAICMIRTVMSDSSLLAQLLSQMLYTLTNIRIIVEREKMLFLL
jgi:hypothetical protein